MRGTTKKKKKRTLTDNVRRNQATHNTHGYRDSRGISAVYWLNTKPYRCVQLN